MPAKRGPAVPRGGAGPPRALAVALVAAAIAAAYAHTLSYPFHFDDYSSIRDNAVLDRPADLGAIWSFRPSRVVAHLSFAANIAVTGRATAGLRAVNLLVHLLASLLVGWIAAELTRRLTGGRAGEAARGGGRGRAPPGAVGLIAALIFAAHPLATQAVTYLVQRTTSLAALFELSAVALYLRARVGGGGAWPASWACAGLAALTKEMAVALPVLIGLLELALRRAGAGAAPGTRLAPYLAVIPLVAWAAQLHAAELGRAASGLRETAEIGRAGYLLTQLVVVPRYLALWLWPRGQTLDPAVALREGLDPAALAGAGLLAAASLGAFALRRRVPLAALGWGWFLIALLPESSVIPIRDVMVEHRAYLPAAGLCWGAAAALARLPGGAARRVVPAALVALLAVVAHARNRAWRDETSLWTDVTRKSPGGARGFNNLAMALEQDGRVAEAEAAYRRAIAVEPRYVYARVNLGRLYGLGGRFREAVAVLEEARALAPDHADVLTNLGSAWWGLGDTARAAAAYERALEISPGLAEPALNLARMRGLPGTR